jgi:hypothetical protein
LLEFSLPSPQTPCVYLPSFMPFILELRCILALAHHLGSRRFQGLFSFGACLPLFLRCNSFLTIASLHYVCMEGWWLLAWVAPCLGSWGLTATLLVFAPLPFCGLAAIWGVLRGVLPFLFYPHLLRCLTHAPLSRLCAACVAAMHSGRLETVPRPLWQRA